MAQNSCYTYFTIAGEFKHEDITKRLNLTPYRAWNKGDLRISSTSEKEFLFTFSRWSYGECTDYEQCERMVSLMMSETIKDLIPKKAELLKIKEDYDAGLYLVVVPEIYIPKDEPSFSEAGTYVGEIEIGEDGIPFILPGQFEWEGYPCLSPQRDIIEFLYETKTELDIDYYIFPY